MFPVLGGVAIQVFNVIACIRIVKNKSLYASVRWFWSLLVFAFPIVGVILFKICESRLRANSYIFFSEEFIDRVLYRSVKSRF